MTKRLSAEERVRGERIKSISKERLQEAVNKSKRLRDVQRNLGYRENSGSVRAKISALIKEYEIDISHFGSLIDRVKEGQRNSKKCKVIPLSDILVEKSEYSSISSLKKRLVSEKKMQYKCVACENEGSWKGKSLTLQLDHINGIPNDHRIENLRFLCPNCHSQTETFSGRNKKILED
jgi:Zn finger protein HypA/HybF involved in hydrogenase expression